MRLLNWRSLGAAMVAPSLALFSHALQAQQTPIAFVSTAGVTVSGSMSVENGRATIGNDGTITAGDGTAMVKLARGGDMEVCSSTKVHLSRDTSVPGPADSALMIALDRGALEASYVPGKYSDVLLTPDLRILVSGPGTADLKIRVNEKGDTCLDNHGANAPYVTVTNLFEGGVYRVQPNQRVMFEHGSLEQVVDNETEPCGCPVAAPSNEVASASAPAKPTRKTEAEAANPFPLAQSEGLASAPAAPVKPESVGATHAEVEAPIAYDATATPNPSLPGAAGPAPVSTESHPLNADIAAVTPAQMPQQKHAGFFHSVGHFFAKMFGA